MMPKGERVSPFLVRANLLALTGPICALCGVRLELGWVVALKGGSKLHQHCALNALNAAIVKLRGVKEWELADLAQWGPADREREDKS